MSRISLFYAKLVLRSLGIRWRLRGTMVKGNVLIVSNHMSYLDILVFMASLRPFVFITSREIAADPFMGIMSKFGRSIFVERRNKSSLIDDINKTADMLKKESVFLFPEGTSTNGEKIHKFKSALFDAAHKAQVKIVPICINYRTINGKKFSKKNRDTICYYRIKEEKNRLNKAFFTHVNDLLKIKSLIVDINVLKPIDSSRYSRKELADLAFEEINRSFIAVKN